LIHPTTFLTCLGVEGEVRKTIGTETLFIFANYDIISKNLMKYHKILKISRRERGHGNYF
jgi:hypothetical protein